MSNGEDVVKVVKFTCKVGDLVKIKRPVGYPAVKFSVDYDTKQYLNGFVILYPELGEFEGSPGNAAVFYRHTAPGRQVIEFLSADLGRYRFRAEIESIVVHDHASVHTGGPAFATYYAHVPTQET